MRIFGLIHHIALIVTLVSTVTTSAQSSSEPAGLDFFEQRVRPLLAENCYSCHSGRAEKLKGGLLLDTRAGLLQGGESGPVIVPGDPEKSLLIKAIRYNDENLQMPPKNKKLRPEQIASLEAWVKMGAPSPEDRSIGSPPAQRLKHWAFQPVRHPEIPTVKDVSWIRDPIDLFVLAKLEANGLTPSPTADKRTLIRRVTYDLTGLPPTQEELESFLDDNEEDAFAKVVDRLLASPQYGERWARHWLDVARYADTKGYVFEEERRYPYAYTYRDYVIRAFNDDLPFDQFIREQLAADRLPLGEDKHALAALGYLTLGRRFLNNQPDIIDDRIDVVTRGLMGLTVACARCHDHKFDPITSKDYYSLYGVFASCSEPEEKPILSPNDKPPQYAAYLEEHQKRLEELHHFQQSKEAEIRTHLRQSINEYLLAAHDIQNLADPSRAEGLARERKLDPQTVHRWVQKLENLGKVSSDPVFGLWMALSECPNEDFAEQAQNVLNGFSGSRLPRAEVNPVVARAFADAPPTSLLEVADRYGSLLAEVDRIWQATLEATTHSGHPKDSSGKTPEHLAEPALEELRQVLYASDSPTAVPESEIKHLFDVPSIQKLRALQRKADELDATHPGAPARAMALKDNPTPQTPHVFLRGNPANLGPEVPRQFIAVLSGGQPEPFKDGSGRLELADAIASRKNPLTARVLVNRVWLQYFGAGLVRTPSDFGLRSEPPTHPELLEYLANRFMDEGWSLKKLHRWIVLSSTYQQSSEDRPALAQRDPSNLLLWKMNRRRLDFEALRDSLLVASGHLDLTEGGHSVDITVAPWSERRTIYGFVERQNLPGIFRTFDFASPDTTSPQRFSTTVPQQALFMMNSPFVVKQVRFLALESRSRSGSRGEDRVRALYEFAYQREPTQDEVALGLRFIADQNRSRQAASVLEQIQTATNVVATVASTNPAPALTASAKAEGKAQVDPGDASTPPETLDAWERYAQVLLMANEFCFID